MNIEQPTKEQINNAMDRHDRHIARAKNAGSYFSFFAPHTRILSKLTALFLQQLYNIAGMEGTIRQVIDGHVYFMCTSSYLLNSCPSWTEEEQRYHFKRLSSGDDSQPIFVHVVYKGLPRVRWVRILYNKIENALDNYEDNRSEERIPTRYQRETSHAPYSRGNKRECSPEEHSRGNKRECLRERSRECPPDFQRVKNKGSKKEERKGGDASQARVPAPPEDTPLDDHSHRQLDKGTRAKVKERAEHHANSHVSDPPPSAAKVDQEKMFRDWHRRLRITLRKQYPAVPLTDGTVDTWVAILKRLWRDLGRDSDYLDRFLTAYDKVVKQIKEPTINSAKQFREQFPWLRKVLERMGAIEPQGQGETVEDIHKKVNLRELPNGRLTATLSYD